MKKDKGIVVSGVSPDMKKNLTRICNELGVTLTCLFKIEGRKVLKEFDIKYRTDYGSK